MVWRRDGREPAGHPPGELSAAARLVALEARVDQVRAFFREQAKAHRGNGALLNVLLDADNMLHGPYPESPGGGG